MISQVGRRDPRRISGLSCFSRRPRHCVKPTGRRSTVAHETALDCPRCRSSKSCIPRPYRQAGARAPNCKLPCRPMIRRLTVPCSARCRVCRTEFHWQGEANSPGSKEKGRTATGCRREHPQRQCSIGFRAVSSLAISIARPSFKQRPGPTRCFVILLTKQEVFVVAVP